MSAFLVWFLRSLLGLMTEVNAATSVSGSEHAILGPILAFASLWEGFARIFNYGNSGLEVKILSLHGKFVVSAVNGI
jgi:hypothetical protein